MKKGDIAKIYRMPLTHKDYEGTAKLLRRIESIDFCRGILLERWEVEFESDGFICERLISYEAKNEKR
jgi:hypothetical protein